MRFQANYVSISVSGDYYYQAMFEAEEDTTDPDSPYLLIQRQFETSDGGRWCYIETHDEKYIGHFLLRRVEFTPERIATRSTRSIATHLITSTPTASWWPRPSRSSARLFAHPSPLYSGYAAILLLTSLLTFPISRMQENDYHEIRLLHDAVKPG
jgi:hypothetical protein